MNPLQINPKIQIWVTWFSYEILLRMLIVPGIHQSMFISISIWNLNCISFKTCQPLYHRNQWKQLLWKKKKILKENGANSVLWCILLVCFILFLHLCYCPCTSTWGLWVHFSNYFRQMKKDSSHYENKYLKISPMVSMFTSEHLTITLHRTGNTCFCFFSIVCNLTCKTEFFHFWKTV